MKIILFILNVFLAFSTSEIGRPSVSASVSVSREMSAGCHDCCHCNQMTTIKAQQSKMSAAIEAIASSIKLEKNHWEGIEAMKKEFGDELAKMKHILNQIATASTSFPAPTEMPTSKPTLTPVYHDRIRLVAKDGTINNKAGRLEVFKDGAWGTVCDDGPGGGYAQSNNNMANVVCRMLGHRGGQVKVEAYFGQGSGEIVMKEVRCQGDERSIFDCENIYQNCGHNEDVGVICE